MNYNEYSGRLRIGQVVGDGVRSYSIEKVTRENTYLRGKPENLRQANDSKSGSLRILPTQIILDIISAIESKKISLNDVLRRNRENATPLFPALGPDYDPFILGYDSTIFKICEFLIESQKESPSGQQPNSVSLYFLPKPFLILAGISGTGKTKWVRDRAVPGKGNVEVVPVRRTSTNPRTFWGT
jgi:hypothetical protein